MSRCIKLGLSICLIMTLNLFAKTYKLTPIDWSYPTVSDTGDGIGGMGPYFGLKPEEAWMAFDLSGIPDDAQITSAALSAYMKNFTSQEVERTLWYYSDDIWINRVNHSEGEPGDYIIPDSDKPNGTMTLDVTQYTWKTIDITHNWSNDLIDNYASFMLTGPQDGSIIDGAIALAIDDSWGVDKAPELVLTTTEEPNDYRIYKNIFDLGPEEIVKADDSEINIGTYSVPSFADWNNDGLKDLIVGTGLGYVKIFLNTGTKSEPRFSNSVDKSFYAQSNGSDLYVPPAGCQGAFPRVVYWDNDKKKDLLVGLSDGSIKIFLNINTDENPMFDGGTALVLEGLTGKIDVGNRAAPCVVDWNNDGRKDIVCGAFDGKLHIFINEGTDAEPVFLTETFAQKKDGSALIVKNISEPGLPRSSPVILDLDFDGKKDILTGNKDGELLLYKNIGTNEEPLFSDCETIDSNGAAIDLTGTPRSRPFVCYWNNDGYPDVIIGALDGKIHLYCCKTLPADFNKDGKINFKDWAVFTAYYSKTKYADKKPADLNNDGKVDIDDASWIMANWLLSTK